MRIGELAARAGVSPDTVRHYERCGVLGPIRRTPAGHRAYDEAALRRLLLVRRALACGFGLRELGGFLGERDRGGAPCRAVRAAAAARLAVLDADIRLLRARRQALAAAIAEWDRRLAASADGQRLHLLDTLPPTVRDAAPRRSVNPPRLERTRCRSRS
jgi:DNA-binding transcriptional MerR regulator